MLRLLVRGHDIKSIARELSISTSAANERLRSARQKLGVSSSREAARALAVEEGDPTFSVDTQPGVAPSQAVLQPSRIALIWIGVIMAVAIITGIALMAVLGSHALGAEAPKVIRTNPSLDAVVTPGPLKLSVTFDRPMQSGSYSFVYKDPATFPNCGANVPAQSQDRRTFVLQCTMEPDRNYELWFNSEPYMNFKGLDGTPAAPFQLRFRTQHH